MPELIKRINLGLASASSSLKIPDLSYMQKESYRWFLEEGVKEIIEDLSPITDYTEKNFSLEIFGIKLGETKYPATEAAEKGTSFEVPIYAKGRLTDLETGQVQEEDVYLGEIPLMTERGTFIINGNERVVVNQLTRAPGVYFEAEYDQTLERQVYVASVRPERGAWLEFFVERDQSITVKINRGRKISATSFLKAFGIRQKMAIQALSEITSSTGESFLNVTLSNDPTTNQDEAFLDVYGKMRPGDPKILENARDYFNATFFDPRRFSLGPAGRFKLNKRLGLNFPVSPDFYLLQPEDLISTVKELISLTVSQELGDNIDHLSNRRLRQVGELIQVSFRIGCLRLERLIRERLSVASAEKKLSPATLVNARPLVASLNEFFGSSQLSQYMDQSNPLSELEHLRRVTALGPGGLSRERAGVAVRDVQSSHYARLDAIKTPEGPNIGLNLSLGIYTRVNQYGFLEAPYRKVEQRNDGVYLTDEIVYLSADDEEEYYIAEGTVSIDARGKILDERVAVRHRGDFFLTEVSRVNFIDAHPSQMLGVSSGLIPFISSDVGNRALMGANMQTQAVPLVKPQIPIVGTGLEESVAADSGRLLRSEEAGGVSYVDSKKIEIEGKRGKKIYWLTKFNRTNENTCYNQSPCVSMSQKVKSGEVLANGPSSELGELALGRDLLAAFMPWEGYNYEDSVVISERLLGEDLLTSIHIREYEASVMDTKLGSEEVTRDIPNVSDAVLKNLDEEGIVVIGANVGPGDILVGKIAPKGETELTAEERLLRAIFGEKAREIRDTSLRMPHGEKGTVISIKILSKQDGDELPPGVLKIIRVRVAQKRKIAVGDKIAGRHGSKGVIAEIVKEEDMPYMEDGTPIDILLNPISILARMNLGQVLEVHLGWAGKKLEENYSVPAYDLLLKGVLQEKLKEAGIPLSGKVTLYDGRTGEQFPNNITVGYAYIMKLHHLVEDKVHARSTGPYSLVTQQPLGGKAQMGGQRLGEMEVWALEAYGAAHNLQEMLTIKSDDVVGRAKAFEAIIKGVAIPEARIPEAFKLLIKELNSLCLSVETLLLEGEKTKTENQEFHT